MMNTNTKTNKTPLEAFRDQVEAQAGQTAMVQPLGGGEIREYSWREMDDETRRVASWLKSKDLPQGSTIALMSKNCAEWIMADLAIWMAGHVSVPLYPTVTADTVQHIVEHSESRLFFAGKLDDWDEARKGIPDGVEVTAFSLAPDDARNRFTDWSQIVRDNEPLPVDQIHQPGDDQLATIIYTSGTTGMPKGVMQSFGSLNVMGNQLPDVYGMSSQDRMISYLPLSHVAERAAVELSMFYVGQKVYFAESLETFGEDIQRARPTLFFAVPRIWNKFYQRAADKLPPEKLDRLVKIPLLNRFIKKKALSAMGLDQCRIALSGASALSPEVIHWFRKLGLEILEVYGMTENMAWSHATGAGDQHVGWVGTPHAGVEHKIGEGGEILVRSPANMDGYYKDLEKTRETLSEDGWLHTGDVGEIDPKGRLRITGRVKEIFKTEKGKYVAPAPIENKMVAHPGLEQACVTGANLTQPIALVCLSEEEIGHLLDDDKEVERYKEGLRTLLDRVNNELEPHEKLDALVIVPETWSVENDMLTPTMKLKRNVIEDHYYDQLPQWQQQGGVVWAR
jgi:long-chain acyl-CoA synthetase